MTVLYSITLSLANIQISKFYHHLRTFLKTLLLKIKQNSFFTEINSFPLDPLRVTIINIQFKIYCTVNACSKFKTFLKPCYSLFNIIMDDVIIRTNIFSDHGKIKIVEFGEFTS